MDVHLPDDLIRAATARARATGRTLEELLSDCLRSELAKPLPSTSLPVFNGGGLQPGVDLNNAAALLDLMDAAPER